MRKARKVRRKVRKLHTKKIKLSSVVQIEVPKGVVPVVAQHPEQRIVEIVPVPKQRKSWWAMLFETESH